MDKPLHIVSVVGARPQFVKLAPISRALATNDSVRHTIVHTGQHYDDNMSSVFFDELEIPRPDVNLDIGSTSHAVQTGRMMEQLESWFEANNPDVVVVYGDTNSTLAASLAAAKIHIPVAHIEAGLRSFNRAMPEEINRVATDHCSDRLYAPTPAGMVNLSAENLSSRALLSGDVMRDAVEHSIKLAEARTLAMECPETDYAMLTLHRPSNTEASVLVPLLEGLNDLAQQQLPMVFPLHPRTRNILEAADASLLSANKLASIKFISPLSYLDMLQMVKGASVVLTDSGGLQKEAAFLGTQCITLRNETEWTETIDIGVNRLVGNDQSKIASAMVALSSDNYSIQAQTASKIDDVFGSGDAATEITNDLIAFFG